MLWYVHRAVIETTISVMNATLYEYTNPSTQVLSWIRTIIANRLATDGESWVSTYSQYNSGTYNNQWMIVDYNKVRGAAGTGTLLNGTFWVAEQLPGHIISEDMTSLLINKTYWGSYNRPYFTAIAQLSMWEAAAVATDDEYYTYLSNGRALMIARAQANV